MTTEEKARAYDEAIEKAQDVFHTSEVIKITDLFPQLAESEDEKAIKLIRSLLENVRNVQSNTSLYKQYDDALAWLEKQKEQGPTDESQIDMKELKWQLEYWFGQVLCHYENKGCPYDDMGEVARHFVDDASERISKKIIRTAVWSEPKINGSSIPTENQAVDISPVEWSEEDERKYQCIRNILLTDMGKKVGSWKYSEILEWYEKRGIGRYTNFKPHWKPSEGQLEALNALNLHGDLSYVGQQNQLISLYQDLKKLM